MDISICVRTCKIYGGIPLYSAVAARLWLALGEYGASVQSIELTVWLPNRLARVRPASEWMFDSFQKGVKKLPIVAFRRKLRRIEIAFLSEYFFGDVEHEAKPSAQKCNLAAREVVQALTLLEKRIKPADDFDVKRFLTDASRLLETKLNSMRAWEKIKQEAQAKQKALRATKSPWNLLEIEWDQYHPKAREILDDPFFWDCVDDLAPHGSDTGWDLMEDYRRWDRRNRSRSPLVFFNRLFKSLDIQPMDWSIVQPEAVKALYERDPIRLTMCDEAAIALAFAVLKMRATCPPEVIAMALAALERTALLLKGRTLSAEITASCDAALATMRRKLESLPH